MASDGSGSHPPEKMEVVTAAARDDLEDSRFQCCICLDILYKPIVLACGHISCFWCVHKAMHFFGESHCAICRRPYNHFPAICQLVHHLLLKLEPMDYKRREKEVLEEERLINTYSPQIIELAIPKNSSCEIVKSMENELEASKTKAPEEVSSNGNMINEHPKKVEVEDVLCPLCKELLYQPAVLNCGHVYCISCLPSLDEKAKCLVCESLHPGKFAFVCLDLDHFLEEYFPVEYALREEKVQLKKSQCHPGESSSGTSFSEESSSTPVINKAELLQDFMKDDLSNIHVGVGCDSCGMFPIRGERYKCKDCTEAIGFDLCGECYNTRSKLPGRFNQQHTPDHQMNLVSSWLIPGGSRL